MRAAAFEYHAAETLDEALGLLAEHGDEARPLSGGCSLVPMMNLRLAQPGHLVDLNRLPLDGLEETGGTVRIGALTRHARLLKDPLVARHLPVVRAAAAHIAHPTIRRRGTFGGSIANADPTAELSLVAVLLDAEIVAASSKGERRIPARDFFDDAYMTALGDEEIVTGVEIASAAGRGWAFEEFAERGGDYAIAAVGVDLATREGTIAEIRIACAGAGGAPVRSAEAEEHLSGRRPGDAAAATEAGRILAGTLDPPDDLRGSGAYRRSLIAELTRRAVLSACEKAAA